MTMLNAAASPMLGITMREEFKRHAIPVSPKMGPLRFLIDVEIEILKGWLSLNGKCQDSRLMTEEKLKVYS